MRREYMSETQWAAISGQKIGEIGAWSIYQAPIDWNDRYLWASDGYWLAPVCRTFEVAPATDSAPPRFAPCADTISPSELASIVTAPEEYCLQTLVPAKQFNWQHCGQVSARAAYRIPRVARWR